MDDQRINVLMNCLASVSGGALSMLRNLAPLLTERFVALGKHTLTFLAHEQQAPLLEGVDPAQISWVRGARPVGYRRILWERWNLPSILRKKGVDVFFTPYQVAPRLSAIRHVMMIRNMEPFLFNGYSYSLKSWLRNRLLRRMSIGCLSDADRVIAVSHFAREQLTRGIGIDVERVRTIYHGRPELRSTADDAKDRAILARIGIEGDYILTCGSLLPYRRCEDVISAFDRCAPTLGHRMRLVIAGSGADRRYGETIRQAISASPERVRILAPGHVPWEVMSALYRCCTACVIATEIEACPNIAIEAMAAGCVIVSADRPPLPEMFQGCSLEYRARDIKHLSDQMKIGVEDDALRSELRAKALNRVTAFSWEKCASETYSALVDW